MVYMERKRIEERDAAEAVGLDLWTDELDAAVRGKLLSLWEWVKNTSSATNGIEQLVQIDIMRSTGIVYPPSVRDALLYGEPALVYSYLEVLRDKLANNLHGQFPNYLETFDEVISETLSSHRIKVRFSRGMIIDLGSEELHAEVIEPVLMLLHGRPELSGAQSAYRDAIKEIGQGNAPDALTDAGSALQETLKAIGCKGNVLGDLIKDAVQKGLLGKRDVPMTEGIKKVLDWVAAERNSKSDSHTGSSDASIEDAWLIVHVVGALIVRLAGPPRETADLNV